MNDWTFEPKRISANPNANLSPETQNPFRENEITSFFRQVSRYQTHVMFIIIRKTLCKHFMEKPHN